MRHAPLAAALAALALLAACGGETPPAGAERAPEDFLLEGPHQTALIHLEGLGAIRIELLPELAPESVANFKKLARNGFYAGTTFHRVIPGFMVQGGDPLTKNHDPRDDGDGDPGYTIPDEFSDFPQVRGVVSMAHRGHRHTAGSQFFIVHRDSRFLDGNYSVFARVVEGIEVVDAITELEIDKYGRYGPQDRPYPQDARILSIEIGPRAASGTPPREPDRHTPPATPARAGALPQRPATG